MRLPRWAWMVGLGCLTATFVGCRSRSDLVEAELRTRNRELAEARQELRKTQIINAALEAELGMRRASPLPIVTHGPVVLGQPTPSSPPPMILSTPQSTPPLAGIRELTLGRGTGGVDDDRQYGDEALQVVVVPRDAAGDPLKVVGSISITAFELPPEGVKVPLGSWEFGPIETAKAWKSSLLGAGYTFVVPWQREPTTDRIRLVVRLVTAEGRPFEAERDLRIVPMKRLEVIPQKEGTGLRIEEFPAPVPLHPPILPMSIRNGP